MSTIFKASMALLFPLIFPSGIVVNNAIIKDSNNSKHRIIKKPKMGIQNASDTFIHSLLVKYPEFFSSALASRNKLGIQVIYTEINRSKKEENMKTKLQRDDIIITWKYLNTMNEWVGTIEPFGINAVGKTKKEVNILLKPEMDRLLNQMKGK